MQLVILMLAGASVISWAIIVFKWRELAAAEQDSEAFLEAYHEGSWDAAFEVARNLDRSPLSAIFLVAHGELEALRQVPRARRRRRRRRPAALACRGRSAGPPRRSRCGSRAGLALLATIGSATPFVGLFGTVIGIINAFTGIGASGSASLAVVAPGIAEALIATAIGLFAAIPATIFYNHLRRRAARPPAKRSTLRRGVRSDDLRASASKLPAPARAVGASGGRVGPRARSTGRSPRSTSRRSST